MNSYERQEIQNIPEKYRPMSSWSYFGHQILYSIPILGLIFLIIHAISGKNINRRSFARSYFCFLIIVLVLVLIILLATGGTAAITAIFKK